MVTKQAQTQPCVDTYLPQTYNHQQ